MVLAPSLAQRALLMGEAVLAEEVTDLYRIAVDALASPVLVPPSCEEEREVLRWAA